MSSVNHTPFNSSEKASRKINLPSACVEFVSESNDDVMLISVENPNLTTPIASDPTEIRKNTSRNVSSSPNARSEVVPVEKKFDFVIDLTREGLSSYSIGPPSSRLHHLRIAPSAEDQAFNTGAFGDHSNSRVQQIGTKPSTRRKKIPVKEKENLQQENTTRRGDGGGYSRVQKSELTGTRPPGMSSSSSDNRKGFNTSFLNQNRTLPWPRLLNYVMSMSKPLKEEHLVIKPAPVTLGQWSPVQLWLELGRVNTIQKLER